MHRRFRDDHRTRVATNEKINIEDVAIDVNQIDAGEVRARAERGEVFGVDADQMHAQRATIVWQVEVAAAGSHLPLDVRFDPRLNVRSNSMRDGGDRVDWSVGRRASVQRNAASGHARDRCCQELVYVSLCHELMYLTSSLWHKARVKLLLAEDDRIVRVTVRDALEEAGFVVTACADGTSALRAAQTEAFAIVLTDVRLPGVGGLELFRKIREVQPGVAVLLMTAFTDIDDAVTVMREGARDYIAKPFEIDELLLRIARVRQDVQFRQQMESGCPTTDAAGRHQFCGTSPASQQVLDRVAAAAESEVNVLITGETGTGKSLCARMIHARSRRAQKPFVTLLCAAIPDTLLESELFGCEKGAFTGADRKRAGRFQAAEGGTLFLDEIGELPLNSQAKLLRVIETSIVEPLGSTQATAVDVRVIAATNRDLAAAMQRGEFRRDLFYRLNVLDIHVPPLRERRADIPVILESCLQGIAARQKRRIPLVDPAAMAALATYEYPGNVRELLHALERAVALCRSDAIRIEHLPADITARVATASPEGPAASDLQPLDRAVEQFERHYVHRVLDRVEGHKGHAAAVLGISRKSLWQRLRERS